MPGLSNVVGDGEKTISVSRLYTRAYSYTRTFYFSYNTRTSHLWEISHPFAPVPLTRASESEKLQMRLTVF